MGYIVIGRSHYYGTEQGEIGFFETREEAEQSAEFSMQWYVQHGDRYGDKVDGSFEIDQIIEVQEGVPFDLYPNETDTDSGPQAVGIVAPPYIFIYVERNHMRPNYRVTQNRSSHERWPVMELEYYDLVNRPDIKSPKGLICMDDALFTNKLQPCNINVRIQLDQYFETLLNRAIARRTKEFYDLVSA